jgi:Protein of unknown function (DUF3105)
VSSRQQEKQRRREERLARERAEKAKAARRKRLQLAIGGLAGVAAIAVVVAIASGAVGGEENGGDGGAQQADAGEVSLPQQQIGELQAAADEAGCRVNNPEIEGAQHEDREFAADDYETNPPTSGNHNPDWYEDGVYSPGDLPRLGEIVHTLEHGRINLQYKPGTPEETVRQLEALVAEQEDGYHMLLYENTTDMNAQVAATAWGHSVTCPRMNDRVFDALRTFRLEYVDQGPENVP